MHNSSTTSYLFFHCNLAFSSIEKALRGDVIDRCYTPMLDLAISQGIPIGIEATGWTLEQIASLRPQWVERLREACTNGQVEFIGSGYAQIIGPLVPASVNEANQRIGQQIYEDILGFHPTIALVNEQAYSTGILEHYVDAGYSAVIMEWDNSRLAHPEWPEHLRYAPQVVCDALGRPVHLLWNQSMIFQQVQRAVYDDIDLPTFVRNYSKQADHGGVLCLYGNDAEIFDFRPGRFDTEAPLGTGEWDRFAKTVKAVRDEMGWPLMLPGEVLKRTWPNGGQTLRLESAAQPVPVKKQPKYNLLRWAVTGRNDATVNSRCHALTKRLNNLPATDTQWKELCYLWSSDFRTHITERRWAAFLDRITALENGLPQCGPEEELGQDNELLPVNADARWLDMKTPKVEARLNCRRGLTFESVSFPEVCDQPLFGTMAHGYFSHIGFAADFYSGHAVMELPGEHKRTDLSPTVADFRKLSNGSLQVAADIHGFYCPLRKTITLPPHANELRLEYAFRWQDIPACSLRLLHLTLFPNVFSPDSLYYATHDGGKSWENFALYGEVNHGAPVSFLVSAGQAFGMTEGKIRIGDDEKHLEVAVDLASAAVVGMIMHVRAGDKWLTRLTLSSREMDDTAKRSMSAPLRANIRISAAVRSRE
jgi:hypothetical protein